MYPSRIHPALLGSRGIHPTAGRRDDAHLPMQQTRAAKTARR
jgi:hypothetical protein